MYRVSDVSASTSYKLVLIICALWGVKFVFCSDNETSLINKLLRKYQRYSRPVADPSSSLSLNITLTLKHIIDLDERNQLLQTNLWLDYYWFDDKLQWKPVSIKYIHSSAYFSEYLVSYILKLNLYYFYFLTYFSGRVRIYKGCQNSLKEVCMFWSRT